MSAGYVAKAIWLAVHSEPEKVPLFRRCVEQNLGVSAMSNVKCVTHIFKKSALEFEPMRKNISIKDSSKPGWLHKLKRTEVKLEC